LKILFSELGIYLSNTPAAVNDTTATTTALYLLLATWCRFTHAERSLWQLHWKPKGNGSKTHDITGKTLAVLAHAFPMRIIYYSRAEDWPARPSTASKYFGRRGGDDTSSGRWSFMFFF
jgi:lactate dehydrogenase-like 2-hydroxyacid dehydrogenase